MPLPIWISRLSDGQTPYCLSMRGFVLRNFETETAALPGFALDLHLGFEQSGNSTDYSEPEACSLFFAAELLSALIEVFENVFYVFRSYTTAVIHHNQADVFSAAADSQQNFIFGIFESVIEQIADYRSIKTGSLFTYWCSGTQRKEISLSFANSRYSRASPPTNSPISKTTGR